MKSLVIEDDASSNTMFVRFLENYGECDSVSTGYDGMQKHKESLSKGSLYDLIIIDIILPDMNGYTVLESIRDEESFWKIPDAKRSKIVLTTSLDDSENRKVCEKLKPGMEVYYAKSPLLDGLKDALKEVSIKLN